MTMRRVVAIAIVATLITGGLVDRNLDSTPAVGPPEPPNETTESLLAALGPIDLINNEYALSMTFPCIVSLKGSITIDDVLDDPAGVTIDIATPKPNGIKGWFSSIEYTFEGGVLDWQWSRGGGPCSAVDNPAGTVFLALSNGHEYMITINGELA